VKIEIEFRDGDGAADIEERLTGVPTEDGFSGE